MSVGLFGVPTVSTTLCIHLIKGLFVQSFGSCQTISVSAVPDIEKSSCDIGAENNIIFAHIPEPALIEFLIHEKVHLVASISSFEACVRHLIERQGLQPIKAVRDTSLSMAALEDVIFASDVFVIRITDQVKVDIHRMLGRLTEFLGLRRGRLDFNQIIGDLALRAAADGNVYLNDQVEPGLLLSGCAPLRKVAKVDLQLLSSTEGYDSILELRPMSEVCWRPRIFSTKEKVTSAAERIYLVGPSRMLVFGPFAGLPRGKWNATVAFSTADNASGNRLGLDVSQNSGRDILANGEMELPLSGSYSCEVTFTNINPHLPIELRLASKQGAIEGELCFQGVKFERRCLRGNSRNGQLHQSPK